MEGSEEFARAFGDALQKFLKESGMTLSDAAEKMGLVGAGGKQRIHTYICDSRTGKRAMPSAEVLYLTCSKLGFSFDYKGFKITAATLSGPVRPPAPVSEQLVLPLKRQFNLTEEGGTVFLTVKRPPGGVEVSLSLKTAL